jgi:FHS family L-fucose permease-like MFS transporter
MGLFMAGRFTGAVFMGWFQPRRLLVAYSAACSVMMALVIAGTGVWAVAALCGTYFFMSIMFPTIFALGLLGMGDDTKRASSFIIMAIVGGAAVPPLMGLLADTGGMRMGFAVPLGCFLVVLLFALFGQPRGTDAQPGA